VKTDEAAVLKHEDQICKFVQEHSKHHLGGTSEIKLLTKHINALTYSFLRNEQSLGLKIARPFNNKRVAMLDLVFEVQLMKSLEDHKGLCFPRVTEEIILVDPDS